VQATPAAVLAPLDAWNKEVGAGTTPNAAAGALGGWAGEPIYWVLRRGRQRGGDFLSPRYDTWSWGLAPREDAPLAKDWSLYVVSVLLVYVVAALWPVAVLYGAAFHLHLLSPPFVLVLFFAVIPLYLRFWSGRWHTRAGARAGGPVHLG
jgi:hypothetical protein